MGNWLKWCSPRSWPSGASTAIGIGIGAAMGAAANEMALWVGVGAAVGLAFEFAGARTKKST